MSSDPKSNRERTDAQNDIAKRTTDHARAYVASEREAVRKKTELLRRLRLAKEAAAGVTDLDKKPARKKTIRQVLRLRS